MEITLARRKGNRAVVAGRKGNRAADGRTDGRLRFPGGVRFGGEMGGVRFLDGDEGMASTCTGTWTETRKGDGEAPAVARRR